MPTDLATLRRIAAKLHPNADRSERLHRDFAATIAALRSAPLEEVRT